MTDGKKLHVKSDVHIKYLSVKHHQGQQDKQLYSAVDHSTCDFVIHFCKYKFIYFYIQQFCHVKKETYLFNNKLG